MSAIAILSQHRRPLSSMTDDELSIEYDFWYKELDSRYRWDQSPEVCLQAIDDIEAEQLRRKVATIRSSRLHVVPHLVDVPAARVTQPCEMAVEATGTSIDLRVMGAAKARAEYRPSRLLVVGITAALLACLAGVAAVAGQRVVDLNTIYGWENT